jgi:hypothetical protein
MAILWLERDSLSRNYDCEVLDRVASPLIPVASPYSSVPPAPPLVPSLHLRLACFFTWIIVVFTPVIGQ